MGSRVVSNTLLLCCIATLRLACCGNIVTTKPSDFIDDRLGVRKIRIYVRIPLPASNGSLQRNLTATAVGTLWLRRLGGGQAGRYALPHQLPDSIRGFLWLDDPNNFTLAGPTSHASMPVRQDQWQPHLLLDTVAGGPPLRAVVDPVRGLGDTEARPYTFTFHLPQNAGNCFKIREASTPNFATPFCLHHHARLCPALASPEQHSDTRPALWAVFGPVRNLGAEPGPGWLHTAHATAVYMLWYLTYHLAAGMSGALLYGSPLDVGLLQQEQLLQPFLRSGALRLLIWDLPERSEKYNYDQALYLNHALLGLSACGTDLRLLVGDFDEYLLLPRGKPWPDPLPCMSRPGANLTSNMIVNRREAQSTTVPYKEEPEHWTDTTRLKATLHGDLASHAARAYDMVSERVHPVAHAKRIVAPAALVVGYFVHEGNTLHGESFNSPLDCISILHVANMMKTRLEGFRETNVAHLSITNWLVS